MFILGSVLVFAPPLLAADHDSFYLGELVTCVEKLLTVVLRCTPEPQPERSRKFNSGHYQQQQPSYDGL